MKHRFGLAIAMLSLASILPAGAAQPPTAGAPAAAGGALGSKNVEFVANIPDVPAIGARRVGNLIYMTTSQGLRIYDISLGIPVLQGAFELPHWENEDVDTNGKILLIAEDNYVGFGTMLWIFDVSNPHAPLLLSRLDVPSAHTATCINNCTYVWLGGAFGRVNVVDIRNPRDPRNLGSFGVGGTVHDVQVDAKGIAWVSASSGIWGFKPAGPLDPILVALNTYGFHNNFIIHNSLRPNASRWKPAASWSAPPTPGELLLVTEENYESQANGGCRNDGQFQTGTFRTVGGVSRIDRVASFHIGQGVIGRVSDRKGFAATCSSHYFGFQSDVAAVAWYEQGVRFLDVSRPGVIRQIGYYMPLEGAAWSAMYNGQWVYVFDAIRGIDVLKFHGRAGDPSLNSPETNTFVFTRPSPRWGYACRLPVA